MRSGRGSPAADKSRVAYTPSKYRFGASTVIVLIV
jgi:hypothetical protein